MRNAPMIARLTITLDGVRPKVMRRVDVPYAIRLDRLHLVIQAAMGWTDCHLWEFEAGGRRWGDADAAFDDASRPAAKATLQAALEATGGKTLRYTYDFGDGWQHSIKLAGLREPVPDALYPSLLEAQGRCPPEDIGGAFGYAMFLEVIADPQHDDHAEMIEFHGDHGDPAQADTDTLTANVAQLARLWSRRKA